MRAQLMAMLAGIVFVVPVGAYFATDRNETHAQPKDAAVNFHLQAVLVETWFKQAILAPGLLMTGQPAQIDPDRWEASSRMLFQVNEIIEALEIAPQEQLGISYIRGQLTQQSGTAITASAIMQWPTMVATPKAHFESSGDPVISIDKDVIVAVQPIQIRSGRNQPDPWGYAKATMRLTTLSKALRLEELRDQGYSVHLDYRYRDSTEVQPLLSIGGMLRENPINREIILPQGDRVYIGVSPPAGWMVLPIAIPALLLVLLSGLLVGLLTYVLLRRSVQTEEQVTVKTMQLALEKEVLEAEVEHHKRTESLLQDSHALLDSIFEHIPSMIIVKRASDLSVVRVNQLGAAVLGQPKEALIGRSSKELFLSEESEHDTETDLMAIHDGNLVELPEQFIQTPGGTARWLRIKKLALFDASGKPSHVLEIGEDITPHKHLDEALTENLHFVEQLLAAIPTPVFFKDINGCYIGVNKAFEAFYGISGDSVIGKTVFDIAPPHLAETYDKADKDLLESRGTQSYEARVRCADGAEKDVLFFKAVFLTTHAEAGGIVGIILDVTERKSAERHILRLNRTLAVVGETNQAILQTKDCPQLLQKTVDILHEVGGFPLAWVYASQDGLPALPAIGEYAELATSISNALKSAGNGNVGDAGETNPGRCDFYASLSDCDKSLAEIPHTFEGHGLAHLPLRIAGQRAGGICIVGMSEDLLDEKEQSLLASLAENLSHAIDSLEQERARQIAERKLELASHVFENSAEGVMITDRDNKILMVNRRFSEITGYTAEEVAGHTPSMMNSGQQDQAFYSNMWRSLMNRGEWHGEIRNRRKDGEVIVEWLNVSVVKDSAGEISNYVAVFSEITVHKTIKKRMQFLAHYDALTSLPNRILFSDRLEQSIIAARRNKRSTALMFIDLDRFDQINKTVGHSAGDILLQEVSKRLLASVDAGNSVSRLGGDEFAIVLSDIESSEQAAVTANRIQQELSRPIYIGDSELYITASIGISIFPKDGDDAEALTKSADAAMYLAAEAGGNTYRFPQANEMLSEQVQLRDRLYRAIERDEFKVFYQPLISGESGRIVGAEALLRWFRPEFGYVSPEVFVPVLEESGLVVRVGDWVLRTALENNIAWRNNYDIGLFVAVNLSAGQLADEKLVEKLSATMKELAFDPSHLHLEMSESTLMRDAPTGLAFLHQLKELGITLSIDDFGTGYSSLSYLHRFPINALKIDRYFIQDIPNDAEAVAITRTIIAMGHTLDLKIIAEGVETASQVDFLRRAHCDILQGYRFSQAVSAEEFALLLMENNRADSIFPALMPDVCLNS